MIIRYVFILTLGLFLGVVFRDLVLIREIDSRGSMTLDGFEKYKCEKEKLK